MKQSSPPKIMQALLVAIFVMVITFTSKNVLMVEAKSSEEDSDFSSSSSMGGVSAMYMLGDSSVDCGDNTPFYNLTHFTLSLRACDNASDFSLLPHFLANKIGLPHIPPFYGQNGSISELLHGLNYGSARATIMNPNSHSHQSLNQQLRQLFETFQLLQLRLGEENAQHIVESSAVYLSFGKDDYINLYLRNVSGIMLRYSGQEFAHILVDQVSAVLRNLYDANVKKIIVMGMLPLGCTPRIIWEWQTLNAVDNLRGCVEDINELALQFNTLLDERIIQLGADFPDADLVFCDVYQGIMQIMSSPQLYGIEDMMNACCGLGMHGAMIGCLSEEMACSEPSAHLWWDLYNPTKAVNSLLADAVWSGLPFSICQPFPIRDLLSLQFHV